ncbi:hypothetical protein BDN71DRAFT_1508972 [Pleurotus eryngii]|uniref:Uncharacterized protein n=1 Tax=Pleurotus eryngii TaxID=5323 RepID=A0A9P6D535_PLEER|nr:hypothetical protein BDN71DRAFT_1508972 [Pleurotus eryngii]
MNSGEYDEIWQPAGNFIGAFTSKVVVVEEFAKAGVPVWLIQPIKEFNELTSINTITTSTPHEDSSIQLQPWCNHKTLAWNQAADDPQCHNNLMLFSHEFLAYTDFGCISAVRDTIERPLLFPVLEMIALLSLLEIPPLITRLSPLMDVSFRIYRAPPSLSCLSLERH